ncbi:MAG: SDR family oxidoreductase [Rhodospirillaceae bacterium]|jgi:NAD(P)-dependent dehydrogenase (short-subunit alcohol dehydrogenase family)|nr:SDR family oxidoreductase [Rhodospirillaceae bacterium]MBT5564464.1 SDR family oxidoreductase [Rhodospirillaceae bacterium]MBT6089754.1 SDR family oxidoreductase [Rhodospirillaceae bacterium]MBT6961964.1 SDR family oxidoreductase [Rhodospirillaceae bacterium]MBT7450210.1 SDR family oxidoreductase [Rhodospirillaceae bacterium]
MKHWGLIAALTLAAVGARAETVLITGSNRGLGFELASQYAADGWTVIATARTPDDDDALQNLAAQYGSVRIEPLDVTNHAQIDALAEKLRGTAIDVLINNAGVLGDPNIQRLGNLDFSIAEHLFATNTLGPLKIADAFLEHVAASETKKVMNVSSIVGSITLTGGNIYFYRASKTALNMLMRNFAKDTEKRGIIVGMIHPGVVDTDMSAPFDIPKVAVEESATGVRDVIEWYTPDTSGTFMQYTGEPMAW